MLQVIEFLDASMTPLASRLLPDSNDDRQTIHGVAVADSPLGPFTILPDPLLTEAPAEDPFLWYDAARQRFLAVFKDWTGQYTQSNGGLGLMESLDGGRRGRWPRIPGCPCGSCAGSMAR